MGQTITARWSCVVNSKVFGFWSGECKFESRKWPTRVQKSKTVQAFREGSVTHFLQAQQHLPIIGTCELMKWVLHHRMMQQEQKFEMMWLAGDSLHPFHAVILLNIKHKICNQ